jgi:hypothetical protein
VVVEKGPDALAGKAPPFCRDHAPFFVNEQYFHLLTVEGLALQRPANRCMSQQGPRFVRRLVCAIADGYGRWRPFHFALGLGRFLGRGNFGRHYSCVESMVSSSCN